MGQSTKKKIVFVKIQPSAGVDAAPTGAADAVLMADVQHTPIKINSATRTFVRAGFGGFPRKVTTKWAQVDIKVEMTGFGTAGPATPNAPYDALYQICGLANTLTAGTKNDYTGISSALKFATIWVYEDGRLHKYTDCRANLKADAQRNEIGYLTFECIGLYTSPTDAALPAQTLTAWQEGIPFTKDSVALTSLLGAPAGVCLDSWSFDLGNVLVPPTGRVNCANEIMLTNRESSGSFTVEATLVATRNWIDAVATASFSAIDFTLGTVAGNRWGFSSTRMQLDAPSGGEKDNVQLWTFPYNLPPSTPGDEFKITLS